VARNAQVDAPLGQVRRGEGFTASTRLIYLVSGRGRLSEGQALAAPLPIEALVHAAKADDAVARALLAKQNPVLEAALASQRVEGKVAGLAEGKLAGLAEALIAVLQARGIELEPPDEDRTHAEEDAGTLRRWLAGATTCRSPRELLGS